MCDPEPGHDTPEDLKREAAILESRNGIWERRMTDQGKQAASIGAVGLVALLVGIFASPFFINTRGVAGLERTTAEIQRTVEEIKGNMNSMNERVDSNSRQLAIGGRWSLEEEMAYQSGHIQSHSALRERVAILEYKAGIRGE